jgi:hypothetical protein
VSKNNGKTYTSFHQCFTGFVICSFASSTGNAPLFSNVSQYSRSFVSASKHVGKHSDWIVGWRAQLGSGGICTLRTGAGGSCVGGVLHPARLHKSTITSAVQIEMKGGDFLGVGFLRIAQLLFGGSVFLSLFTGDAFSVGNLRSVGGACIGVSGALYIQQMV